MKFVFVASRLMKAKEVIEVCNERFSEEGEIALAQTETQLKSRMGLEQRKKQQAPTLTA
ncbi:MULTISPECIES: hypothetical protein [Bacillus]|uniref:hypothetical protein n=1 Tax=Bacillus TaxID=1386 RepID=UPI001CCA6F7E|nr:MULTISPECIES: hypothetical protein [Bacillus]MCA0163294.1 hypothetical protein [Bacillus sp. RAR_M1_44]MCA0923112.1 hypothetical protein [Bacillus stratosphericus]MCZ2740262.1 hypothetical protein [Bacillus safensis]WOI40432.1 hypothetical protein RZ534_14835 [Bacillus altitudinis]